MNKTYLLIVLAAGITLSCNNPFIAGPNQIKITVSGGTKPVISWKGGPVHHISVSLNDSLITEMNPDGSFIQRKPIVWGWRAYDETGEDIDGIASPVQLGSVIAHATDTSDSAYRTDSLIPGVKYKIQMSTRGPGSVGFIIYSP
jgi:hypothetical protein